MNPFTFFWKSSIGKKWLVALTGLVWVGYVFGHLVGNLQVFAGTEQINKYAALLHANPTLLWIIRAFLILCFVLHVVMTLKVRAESRIARPEPYQKVAHVQARISARSMAISGLVVVAFIIYHLLHLTARATDSRFKSIEHGGLLRGEYDVYNMLVLAFQNPLVTFFYLLSVGLLCVHLSHGFSSLLQTLGLNTRKTMHPISVGSRVLAALVFLGYASIPFSVITGILKPAVAVPAPLPSPPPGNSSLP